MYVIDLATVKDDRLLGRAKGSINQTTPVESLWEGDYSRYRVSGLITISPTATRAAVPRHLALPGSLAPFFLYSIWLLSCVTDSCATLHAWDPQIFCSFSHYDFRFLSSIRCEIARLAVSNNTLANHDGAVFQMM